MLRLLKFLLLFSLFFVSCRSKNKVEQPMIKDFDLFQIIIYTIFERLDLLPI